MTPERLRRIRAVYEAALERDPAAREALLEVECRADGDLRREVERLLGAREHLPNGSPARCSARQGRFLMLWRKPRPAWRAGNCAGMN